MTARYKWVLISARQRSENLRAAIAMHLVSRCLVENARAQILAATERSAHHTFQRIAIRNGCWLTIGYQDYGVGLTCLGDRGVIARTEPVLRATVLTTLIVTPQVFQAFKACCWCIVRGDHATVADQLALAVVGAP